MKPGRAYARNVPRHGKTNLGTFRLQVGSRIVPMSALLERRNPNARRGQQVTGLTPGKRSAPDVWLLRPTLPMLHVGRFAQTSVTRLTGYAWL